MEQGVVSRGTGYVPPPPSPPPAPPPSPPSPPPWLQDPLSALYDEKKKHLNTAIMCATAQSGYNRTDGKRASNFVAFAGDNVLTIAIKGVFFVEFITNLAKTELIRRGAGGFCDFIRLL